MANYNNQTAEQIITRISDKIEQTKTRSAWSRGVKAYANEMLYLLRESAANGWIDADDICNRKLLEKEMLNGARNWAQYSEGGCALIYNAA